MAINHRDSFVVQALQLSDALLVWIGFWLCGPARLWLGWTGGDGAVPESASWALYIAVPFTPLVIERFGFYERPEHRRMGSAVVQLLKGLLVISLIMGVLMVFAQTSETGRPGLGLGLCFSFFLLILRNRVTQLWLKTRVG